MVENLQYVFELKDHGSDHITKILNFAQAPPGGFFFFAQEGCSGRDMQIVPFSFVDSPNLHYSDSCCFQTSCDIN